MTKFIKYLFIVVSLFLINSCSTDEDVVSESEIIADEVIEDENSQDISDEILRLVNEHRQGIGLSILEKNETAERMAIEHTNYMISIEDINHDGFNERSTVLINEENARATGENVASFYPDAASVVAGWLDSGDHRDNIEGNFTHTGIAAIQDSNGRYYYTQIFYR